eukprot:2992560-Alexandrium_andersonii.AAC.1
MAKLWVERQRSTGQGCGLSLAEGQTALCRADIQVNTQQNNLTTTPCLTAPSLRTLSAARQPTRLAPEL